MVSLTIAMTALNPNQEMTDFDYKKYSLENLENWMHDTMSSAEATPREIYDVIVGVVKENYYLYKQKASQADELLSLLNGSGGWTYEEVMGEREYYEPSMPPWGHSDLEYDIHNPDKILSCDKDDPSPECKGAWSDFWEDVDEKHSREYNLREAEYYNKRAQLDADFEKIKAAGGYEWTPNTSEDKVVKWMLPVQQDDEDYYVNFPDDLLDAANLKEGDKVEWIDNKNGTYTLRKV